MPKITGDVADGLKFTATATPESDFLTNRTGFVVLHPLHGVAGKPVEGRCMSTGAARRSRFPKIINPVQPFYDIRALSHEIAPGNWAICRMEGDTFEMEDHRNWTDASFKTYVRPLAEPWPYTLPAGKSFDQSVSLTFTGKLPKPKGRGGSKKIAVTLGGGAGTMPRIGVGVPAEEADSAISAADALKAAGLQQLICQIDCRRGDATALCRRYKQLGDATGAGVVLEIILTGTESPEAELARIGGQAKVAGLAAHGGRGVAGAGSEGHAARQRRTEGGAAGRHLQGGPGRLPGRAPGRRHVLLLHRAQPQAAAGGAAGLSSTHTTCADRPCRRRHLGDGDAGGAALCRSHSTRSFIGKKTPYWVGPSSIAARDNPYGAATAANPDNQRICLADRDPRHRGLFGAAWTLGYVAAFARGGVEAVTLGAATGPRGLLYRPTDTPQPYFDDVKRGFYPLYHVIAGLARSGGQEADCRR